MASSKEIAKKVTQIIIDGLKEGKIVWKKSWKTSGISSRPFNYQSKNEYHGTNVIVLSMIQMSMGYNFNAWVTYNQAKKLGGLVRKGERGYPVVFWKFVDIKEKGSDEMKSVPFLRYFTVFNIEQVDGIEMPKIETDDDKPENDIVKDAQVVIDDYDKREKSLTIEHKKSDRAYYSPMEDKIVTPELEQFDNSQSYYKTNFHELVHSTMTKARCNRPDGMGNLHGSNDYSKEELVAEMGATMLAFHVGVNTDENVENAQAYVNGWIKSLEENPDWIIWAGGRAEKAMNYILGKK